VGDRLSIGELGRRARLSVSAVRFYSDRGLLPPAEVDPATGYRSYCEHQVEDAVLLRELRRLGMPLSDVAVFLGATPAARRALLDRHLSALERRLLDARAVAASLLDHLDRTEPAVTTTINATDLQHALGQVLPAVGRDPARPNLQCVLVEARDESLRLVATDSFRLVVRDLAAIGAPFRALVPGSSLAAWQLSGGVLTLGVEDDALVARSDNVALRTSTVDGEYPDYEAVLTMERTAQAVIVERDAILAALDTVAGERGHAVLFTVDQDIVTIERLEMRATLPCRHDGPMQHVAFLPEYATDAVLAASGPDVVIEITDERRPLVFRSADDGTCTTMLMPLLLA
jgi:DNA polymerase III sliding clamp (beta) subunit (PCNA family)